LQKASQEGFTSHKDCTLHESLATTKASNSEEVDTFQKVFSTLQSVFTV